MLDTFIENFSSLSFILGSLVGGVVGFKWAPNAGGNNSMDVKVYLNGEDEDITVEKKEG